MNSEGIADLPLLRTLLPICQKSQEPSFCEVIDSYSSIWKSGSFENPFATITSLSKLYFRFRRFALLVQTKTSNFYKLWQQHKQPKNMEISEVWLISIPTRTHLQNSPAAAEALTHKNILPWNISQMIKKTIPITMRIAISYIMKQGILFLGYWKVNGNWENMIRVYQWRESHCRANTSIRRNK